MSQFFVKDNSSSAPDIETITGNTGGPVGPDGSFNINLLGAGALTFSGNPGTNTLTGSISGGGLSWTTVTSATNPNPMSVQNGYVPNDAVSLVTLTLPATAVVGDTVRILGKGLAGWQVLQNAGQSIHLQSSTTTVGVAGSLASTDRYDTVELICITINTEWTCATVTGNLTVV